MTKPSHSISPALFTLAIASSIALLVATPSLLGGELSPGALDDATEIECGNLTYAGDKTSVCFADAFLKRMDLSTNLKVKPKFRALRLDDPEIFEVPFCILSGEGSFRFTDKERDNLRDYLTRGGFLLSSPGCSDKAFDQSLRKEIAAIFPDRELDKIPMSHQIFSTVMPIPELTTKGGSQTLVEGLSIDGRLVMVYSMEGLNDVKNAKGCCCCGGDEIRQSSDVNINILTYALLY